MPSSLDAQVELLMQGTEYGDESLRAAMAEELRQRLIQAEAEGRRLRVYCGFDPRTSDLHLGHTIPMRKMRQFQELGHEVAFVIGRFTSLIGDPSDKDKLRQQLSQERVGVSDQRGCIAGGELALLGGGCGEKAIRHRLGVHVGEVVRGQIIDQRHLQA